MTGPATQKLAETVITGQYGPAPSRSNTAVFTVFLGSLTMISIWVERGTTKHYIKVYLRRQSWPAQYAIRILNFMRPGLAACLQQKGLGATADPAFLNG